MPARSTLLVGLLALSMGVAGPHAARAVDTDAAAPDEKVTSTYKEHVVVERSTTERTTTRVTRLKKAHYVCAIFVANRSDKLDDKKVLVMQDFLTGHATDNGFSIIAREDVINAVAKLAPNGGPNKGDASQPGGNLDEMLSNNTSALRLAQNLNADYVLMVTITSYGKKVTKFRDPQRDINLIGTTYQMKTTFRLLDTTVGGSMAAGVATTSSSERVDPRTNEVENENVVDDLLDGASLDMAAMLRQASRDDRIKEPEKLAGREPSFAVQCGVADLTFPEIVKDDKGEYIVTAGRYKLEPLAVTVELDGVVAGTTNDERIPAKPGLHKMRLRRQLFRDWEGTVNIRDGQLLQVAMEMTPEGLREFAQMTRFVNDLKVNSRLTEAQAKLWEGYAKQMEKDDNVRIRAPRDKVDVNVNIDHQAPGDDVGKPKTEPRLDKERNE